MKLHKLLHTIGISVLSMTVSSMSAKGLSEDDIQTVLYIRNEWNVSTKRRPKRYDTWRDARDIADLDYEKREVMVLILLNHDNDMIASLRIAEGSRDNVAVCKQAILDAINSYRACKAVLVHNHPLGGGVSDKDRVFTKSLLDAIAHHACRLVEHYVIIGEQVYGIITKEWYGDKQKETT